MALPNDRLAAAIYDQVATAEMKARQLRFIPRHAVKLPLHAVVAA